MQTQTTMQKLIPVGYQNRIGRHYLIKKCVNAGLINESQTDKERQLRRLIQEERDTGAVICNSDGFFIPDGKEDEPFLREYIRRNESKAKSIFETLKQANKLLEDYESGRLQ